MGPPRPQDLLTPTVSAFRGREEGAARARARAELWLLPPPEETEEPGEVGRWARDTVANTPS